MAGNKLKNCPSCGRLYMDTGIGICQDCYYKEQEIEDQIASYVRDNPKSTVNQIVKELDVKERIVMRMIRNGRFLSSGVEISYPCESCGAPITTGRRCEKCNEKLLKQVQEQEAKRAAAPEAQRRLPGVGMHAKTLHKSKK